MDLQEHYHEHADRQQRMQRLFRPDRVEPGNQVTHSPGRVEGRRGLEHDPDLPSLIVECGDAVRGGFVGAPVPSVLDAVAQQVTMQLADVFSVRPISSQA